MKTFKEFLLIAERYYKPTEKLPSGKSPIRKYSNKAQRLLDQGKIDQSNKLQSNFEKVLRGADNPRLITTPHDDLDITDSKDDNGVTHFTSFHHKPSNITYNVSRRKNLQHTISWHHHNEPKTEREKRKIISNAKKVWSQHIEPRLPHGAILHNTPLENKNSPEKNTRAKVYQKYGFGAPNESGDQYAKVGRPPSPRQASKGKRRLKPITSPVED